MFFLLGVVLFFICLLFHLFFVICILSWFFIFFTFILVRCFLFCLGVFLFCIHPLVLLCFPTLCMIAFWCGFFPFGRCVVFYSFVVPTSFVISVLSQFPVILFPFVCTCCCLWGGGGGVLLLCFIHPLVKNCTLLHLLYFSFFFQAYCYLFYCSVSCFIYLIKSMAFCCSVFNLFLGNSCLAFLSKVHSIY